MSVLVHHLLRDIPDITWDSGVLEFNLKSDFDMDLSGDPTCLSLSVKPIFFVNILYFERILSRFCPRAYKFEEPRRHARVDVLPSLRNQPRLIKKLNIVAMK